MADIVSAHLGLVGAADDPFSGRVTVRRFPHGAAEVVYTSARGPSELETLNAWFVDAGIDNKVLAGRVSGVGSRPGGESVGDSEESNAARSARRAKQRVRWSLKAVGADRLLTLTYRENQTDFRLAKKHLAKFVAMCRRRWPGFQYVAIPEEQVRGAWHWHLGVRGFQNVDVLRGYWWRAVGERVSWSDEGKPVLVNAMQSPGNVDVTTPRHRGQARRVWDVDRLCNYLSKYLTKAIEGGLDHLSSYSVTRGLKWIAERYVIRALDFPGVVQAFFDVLDQCGVQRPWMYQSPDRCVLWASGHCTTAG